MNKFFVLGMTLIAIVSMMPMNGQEEILLKFGCQPPIDEYIKVDRSSYCIGDPITVYIFVPGTGEVTVEDHMTNGDTQVIFQQTQSCGQDYWYTLVGYVEGPPGTEVLEYKAHIGCCSPVCTEDDVIDYVSFEIEDCCEEWLHVICNEGGYDLYVDGVYILTEDGDGECSVKLEKGTYTVQLEKDGCDTVTETIEIVCVHETILTVTMNCDPCIGVTCGTVCKGDDLWSQKCVDGKCVDDQLVEANSTQCNCIGVVCSDICKDHDLWSQKCVDGKCVVDELLESNSPNCITEKEREARAHEDLAEQYEEEATAHEITNEWKSAAESWEKTAREWESAAKAWGNPTNLENARTDWGYAGGAWRNAAKAWETAAGIARLWKPWEKIGDLGNAMDAWRNSAAAYTNAENQDEVINSNNEAERVEWKKWKTILIYLIPTVILILLVLGAALIK